MFLKQCPQCGQNKGINYFYRRDGNGTYNVCKDCREALFNNKSPFEK
jgi:hypothetical protein